MHYVPLYFCTYVPVEHYIMPDTYLPTLWCKVQEYISTYSWHRNSNLRCSVMIGQIQGTELKPSYGGAGGARVTWGVAVEGVRPGEGGIFRETFA